MSNEFPILQHANTLGNNGVPIFTAYELTSAAGDLIALRKGWYAAQATTARAGSLAVQGETVPGTVNLPAPAEAA